jgi:hypothetical protein
MQCFDVSAFVVAEKYITNVPSLPWTISGAQVLGLEASTQDGRLGNASFCEPSEL